MGNKVEENIGGVVNEYVAAFGISAQMTGQTEHATSVSRCQGVWRLYTRAARCSVSDTRIGREQFELNLTPRREYSLNR